MIIMIIMKIIIVMIIMIVMIVMIVMITMNNDIIKNSPANSHVLIILMKILFCIKLDK